MSHLKPETPGRPEHILIEGVKSSIPAENAHAEKFDQLSPCRRPLEGTSPTSTATSCADPNQNGLMLSPLPNPETLSPAIPERTRTIVTPRIPGTLDFSTPESFSVSTRHQNLLDAIVTPQGDHSNLASPTDSMGKIITSCNEETLNTPQYMPQSVFRSPPVEALTEQLPKHDDSIVSSLRKAAEDIATDSGKERHIQKSVREGICEIDNESIEDVQHEISKAISGTDEASMTVKVEFFEDEEPIPSDICRAIVKETSGSEVKGASRSTATDQGSDVRKVVSPGKPKQWNYGARHHERQSASPRTIESMIGSIILPQGNTAAEAGTKPANEKDHIATSSSEETPFGDQDNLPGRSQSSKESPVKGVGWRRADNTSTRKKLNVSKVNTKSNEVVLEYPDVFFKQNVGDTLIKEEYLISLNAGSAGKNKNTLSKRRRSKPIRFRDTESVDEEEYQPANNKEDADDASPASDISPDPKPKRKRWIKSDNREDMKRPHYKREPNIACRFCKSKLKDVQSLYNHTKLKHRNVDGYKDYLSDLRDLMKVVCPVCDKVFSCTSRLALHMGVVHTENTQAKCPKCDVVVKSEKHLKDHMRRIHSSKDHSFLCHLCPASFRLQVYLTSHLKHVHTENAEDAFPCDQCDRKCSTIKYLQNHKMRVHSSKDYVCTYCSKAFAVISNMKRHILLRHERGGEKPFICTDCGKHFTLAANLKHHVNTIHLNKYSVYCPICSLGFCRQKDLEMHKTAVHGSGVAPRLMSGSSRKKISSSVPMSVVPFLSGAQTLVTLDATGKEVASVDNPAGIQYIIATPEMLQAFGVQMAPDEDKDNSSL